MDPDAPVDSLLGLRFGDYLVVEPRGKGGMGSVYLAHDLRLGRRVALKVLTSLAAAFREKFELEAAALARIDRPHIVRLYHYGEAHGRPYLAMEFIDGESLETVMAAGLSTPEQREVLRQIGRALGAAHAGGLVHRDIKPANVMLQRLSDGAWFAHLVDFGIAKDLDGGTSTGFVTGTPVYMAPEQFRQSGLGPWTDVYAFAILALEMISGQRPFGGLSDPQIFGLKVSPDEQVRSTLVDALPTPFRAPIRQALAFEAEARPTLTALLVALDQAFTRSAGGHLAGPRLASEPPLVKPVQATLTGPSIIEERAKRRWPVVAVGVLICGLVGGGLAWALTRSPPVDAEDAGIEIAKPAMVNLGTRADAARSPPTAAPARVAPTAPPEPSAETLALADSVAGHIKACACAEHQRDLERLTIRPGGAEIIRHRGLGVCRASGPSCPKPTRARRPPPRRRLPAAPTSSAAPAPSTPDLTDLRRQARQMDARMRDCRCKPMIHRTQLRALEAAFRQRVPEGPLPRWVSRLRIVETGAHETNCKDFDGGDLLECRYGKITGKSQ